MSPESLDGRPYTTKSDIYALGCVMHELCSFAYAAIRGLPGFLGLSRAQTTVRSVIRVTRSAARASTTTGI
jgi:serine/threonine protein kinase